MIDRPVPQMVVVDHGTEAGIDWATCEAPLYGAINGYVRIPEGHPWHGLNYEEIYVEAPGGLTYSENGWIGFDTLHLGDYWPGMRQAGYGPPSFHDMEWDAGMVAEEARLLAQRVAEAAS
ncbi:gp121 [Mycobacterium phage Omega]|uniref:Uncharacterized protein n=1 Tax=Mycobacterium phage Omega TaxID=2907835 RepID=Q854E7_BPMOM|nr:gp121 [Mycobacterium phage Omega]AAN12761.1 hypothetical protein PBI_OMEGA_121 [Mycobacterium phage Omega]